MKRITVVILGAILLGQGVVVSHAYEDKKSTQPEWNPEKAVQGRLERTTAELKLTPDQQKQVKQILLDASDQMKLLYEQRKAVRKQTDDKITALLTDEQKKTQQEMIDKRKAMKEEYLKSREQEQQKEKEKEKEKEK